MGVTMDRITSHIMKKIESGQEINFFEFQWWKMVKTPFSEYKKALAGYGLLILIVLGVFQLLELILL